MSFKDFIKVYEEDLKPRLKLNTWRTKEHIIRTKILPYFGKKKINEITATDIIKWQNEMIKFRDEDGNPYSPVYLKTLNNQFSAILNHAVRLYGLSSNPMHRAGSMGKEKNQEMLVWTKEDYLKFSSAIQNKPMAFMAFELLYWCGLRVGELLALTADDIDFDKKTLRINKSFQRIDQEDYITSPKTEKSNRVIVMPDFLCEELQSYINMLYGFLPTDRLFQVTKNYLHHEMNRGTRIAGVKRIRLHDLRHSHVSLLISMGFSAVEIAKRVGHESIKITLNYAHMFPTQQQDMAHKLDDERKMESCKNQKETEKDV